ncbi:hypothetical protein PF005_g28253 [Phytophthora fragariae]|uniref:Uncharacterized protein n=1 Tax=Phytophthora fragariae TaxID=53985 RepID=A0A6A3W8F2_9STRA|nr:hypothetical protein PF003_g19338 [Phytophthora fragariae]KAE8920903.1 hypothetical protein PF009_g28808 [Phytophthora fragariae]KAE9067036.1 hypothetical protein PF007_g28220 [Phytophthora fragariae]KAE9069473.1 hypothetical protein PF010_g26653 [Phytophthora fragariae]KAE9077730.1 hypothetical protein PF006_g27865 [Phytophthora fragariae]
MTFDGSVSIRISVTWRFVTVCWSIGMLKWSSCSANQIFGAWSIVISVSPPLGCGPYVVDWNCARSIRVIPGLVVVVGSV